jgi:hypothetical protein
MPTHVHRTSPSPLDPETVEGWAGADDHRRGPAPGPHPGRSGDPSAAAVRRGQDAGGPRRDGLVRVRSFDRTRDVEHRKANCTKAENNKKKA